MELHDEALGEMDPVTLYRVLALRSQVFVVEQRCAYLDLDGRDLEPSARQLWIERDGEVLATLRILVGADGVGRIGRVATRADARHERLATRLIDHALATLSGCDVSIDAQSHLERWYERVGFVRTGPNYIEDGIEHLPMRRPASALRSKAASAQEPPAE